MRKTLIGIVALLGQICVGHSQAPCGINSCKIVFEFSNGFQKGTKTLIFNDSGRVEKQIGVTQVDTSTNNDLPKGIFGSRTVYNSLIIKTKDSIFNIDSDSLKGNKRAVFLSTNGYKELLENGMATKVGTGIFLGRKCDMIDMGGAQVWYWKGIALKKELLGDKIYEHATSIEEHYVIKPDEFEVPKNVRME
jgi:hypothetical protein